MKIVGFAQLHEEKRRGFLDIWLQSMERVCDLIYIWDQNSQDGSREVYREHPKCVVVEHDRNDFNRELACKQRLLEKLLAEQPDTDWIFWMDGDTVLEEAAHEGIKKVMKSSPAHNLFLGHLNLWRGTTHYRFDKPYRNINWCGVPCIWRVRPGMKFNVEPGLHKKQYPISDQIQWIRKPGAPKPAEDPNGEGWALHLLHLGFSTDEVLYDRIRRDPVPSHHRPHYAAPCLRVLPEGMLPPFVERVQSVPSRLPRLR